MGTKKIDEAFQGAKKELAGLKAISAVEVESGLAHGSLIIDKAFDLDAASAYNAEVLKAKIKARDAMGMHDEKLDTIIIELSNQLHLILPTEDCKYLATDRSNTNMGIAHKVIMDVGKKIEAVLS